MLTIEDRTKLCLRGFEFDLPVPVIRHCLKLGLVKDPYVQKDHQLKCIFLHVPKAAGTSLRKSVYGTKSFHIPALRYKAANPEQFEGYFKFCFVRNPWERLLSAFEYLKTRCYGDMSFPDHRWAASNLVKYKDFRDFVMSLEKARVRRRIKKYIHFRDQLDWICCPQNPKSITANFVGRYETIQDDYERLGQMLNLPDPLPFERKSRSKVDYGQFILRK